MRLAIGKPQQKLLVVFPQNRQCPPGSRANESGNTKSSGDSLKNGNNLFSPSSCAGTFSWDQQKRSTLSYRLSLCMDECPRRSAEGCWKMFRIPSLTPAQRGESHIEPQKV